MNEQKMIDMYLDNHSTYSVAKAFNTYANEVNRVLKKHGIPVRTRSAAQSVALKTNRTKHPTQGKQRTQAEKIKISAGLSSSWENLADDERERRVDIAKARWAEMSSEKKAQIQDAAIAGIQEAGKSGSKLEKFMLRRVSDAGFRVEFHKKNLLPHEKLEIDLYIPDVKTIIEIDGPSHFLPVWGEAKLQKQIKADSQKSGLILSKGYAIIRVKSVGFVSLSGQEELVNKVIALLNDFKTNYPPESKRFIEIEL